MDIIAGLLFGGALGVVLGVLCAVCVRGPHKVRDTLGVLVFLGGGGAAAATWLFKEGSVALITSYFAGAGAGLAVAFSTSLVFKLYSRLGPTITEEDVARIILLNNDPSLRGLSIENKAVLIHAMVVNPKNVGNRGAYEKRVEDAIDDVADDDDGAAG